MKRAAAILLALLLLAMTGAVRAETGTTGGGESGGGAITSIDQLRGKCVGCGTGTTFDEIVKRRLPDVTFRYFMTYTDMIAALQSGKIDAFACDEPVLRSIMVENRQVAMLPESLDTFDFAYIFKKDKSGAALRDQMSEFIRDMRDSGALSELQEKWFDSDMNEAEMPDINALSRANGTLIMATEAMSPPFEFARGNSYAGFDIELAIRFCERYGYGLSVRNMDFDAVLTSVMTGKADFGGAAISVTPERAQNVHFSEPYFTGGAVLAVMRSGDDGAQGAPSGGYASFSELEDKRIGVTTGSVQALLVEERFPDAKIFFFSTSVDMLGALRAHKIDAYADAEALIQYMVADNPDLAFMDERLGDTMQVGAVFPKTDRGRALRDEYSAFIRQIRENGVYDEIQAAWFGEDESKRVVPGLDNLPATNGTLRVAMDTTCVPFAFIKDGKPVGVDVDTLARFCKERGYGLEIAQMDFGGIIPAVVAGKADFGCGGIAYTSERAESVLYSEFTYEGGSLMAVLKPEATASAQERAPSFWEGIVSSFNKTFVREDRWQLFGRGVLTTLTITVSSILFGTALGFLVFMLCRKGNRVANAVTNFCLWLVQGMPMVVLLMIFYYIIFGSFAISGVTVAVIGFTLTFGAAVFGLMKMGVGAVEGGQYEAAYALGYSDRRTFFRIILPQALTHVLPAYQGEIVGLIKATAVVGYIAVKDLTKMGDIVRSRTYEAFFPLIAVTVIYFVLEGVLRRLVSRITIQFNPRRRKPEDILKGVKTDDQN